MNLDKITIIGLGYVGLPLAIELGKKYQVVGFDIQQKRISELKKYFDSTLQVKESEFKKSKHLTFSSNQNQIKKSNIYIITVPTPIDRENKPDLRALREATKIVGKNLSKGSTVVYESTVFPGATEEICVPILEKISGLKFNKDFFCGYSPERINPGDSKHTLTRIKKVVSASNNQTLMLLENLYGSIITAGIYSAPSIRIAEAAKVIENTQRDINIALMNELSLIFNRMNIDTLEVLKAAETKWNFMPFKPGLVGGHCIGVDPYYLTYKAQELGYDPKIILSGRKLNNEMPASILRQIKILLKKKKISLKGARALVMGLTFKEDCPDLRNSKVIDLVTGLQRTGLKVDCYDPWVDVNELKQLNKLNLKNKIKKDFYDLVVIAVPHSIFKKQGIKIIKKYTKQQHVIFDVKGLFKANQVDGRL